MSDTVWSLLRNLIRWQDIGVACSAHANHSLNKCWTIGMYTGTHTLSYSPPLSHTHFHPTTTTPPPPTLTCQPPKIPTPANQAKHKKSRTRHYQDSPDSHLASLLNGAQSVVFLLQLHHYMSSLGGVVNTNLPSEPVMHNANVSS